MGLSDSTKIALAMRAMLEAMRKAKPGDRSEGDRRWAVAITQFEVALAVFLYQVVDNGEEA